MSIIGIDIATGTENIYQYMISACNMDLVGNKDAVMIPNDSNFTPFEVTQNDNNHIYIGKGVGYLQGRRFYVDEATNVDLTNGVSGYKRISTVCVQYSCDTNGIERFDLVSIDGAAASSNPNPPTPTQGDVESGETYQMPIANILKTGTNITEVSYVYPEVPAISKINDGYKQLTTPASFTAPTPSAGRTTIGYGGYVRIGKLVLVDMVLMITSDVMTAGAKWKVALNMPEPRNGGAALSASLIGRYALTSCHVDVEGSVYVDTNVALPSQFGITITGIYYAV